MPVISLGPKAGRARLDVKEEGRRPRYRLIFGWGRLPSCFGIHLASRCGAGVVFSGRGLAMAATMQMPFLGAPFLLAFVQRVGAVSKGLALVHGRFDGAKRSAGGIRHGQKEGV